MDSERRKRDSSWHLEFQWRESVYGWQVTLTLIESHSPLFFDQTDFILGD